MATFLTTRKMSPALAARVEASVRGVRVGHDRSIAPRYVSLLRLTVFVLAAGLAVWVIRMRHRQRAEREKDRAALLEQVQQAGSDLDGTQKGLAEWMSSRLAQSASAYGGDRITDAIRGSTALSAALQRPMVYVRGPIASFATSRGVVESASTSFKDAFLLCLLAPPASDGEQHMLARARAARTGGHMAEAADVVRLLPALLGLPFLAPAWAARLESAETQREIQRLGEAFERAPLDDAKRAARAELFLFVLDEPNDGSGPTELDGESPHHVRIELVELRTERVLFRLRRHVNPSWIQPSQRPRYAGGMDGCRLALEVHRDIGATREARR